MTYYLTRIMHSSLNSFDDLENLDIWKDAEEDPALVEHHVRVQEKYPRIITPLGRYSKRACEKCTIKESDNLEELIEYATMLML